jgi:hypothetical protein
LRLGDGTHPTMDRRGGGARPLKAQALDQRDKIGGRAAAAGITAGHTGQASQPMSPITRQPALCRPERNAGVGRGPSERHAVLEGRPERDEAVHGLAVLLLVRRHG